jgi:AcrR family transcriptional regulator
VSNATQERILDAAWALVRDRGPSTVTVADIAAAAGVSRQLVYFHFANRAGLLVAMTRHQDTRSGFRARAFATRELPPVEAFTALLAAWHEYVPEILPVALDLEAAAITGEDGADAWRDRMGELHEAIRLAVERVEQAGALAPGWTTDTAADWAWARCQPSAWRHLVGERGWKPDEFARRSVTSIAEEVLNPRSPNV